MAKKLRLDFTPVKPVPKTGKIRLDFRPLVFMRDRTHSYLWVRDGRSYGYFLTIDSGSVELVKVDIEITYERDEKNKIIGETKVYRVYETKEKYFDLEPKNYDFRKALEKYHSSLLSRSNKAEREMRALLGLEPLELTDEEGDVTPQSKPERAPKGEPKAAAGYSLAALCAELKMEPGEARKILRSKKIEKPGGKWEWASPEAAAHIRTALGG